MLSTIALTCIHTNVYKVHAITYIDIHLCVCVCVTGAQWEGGREMERGERRERRERCNSDRLVTNVQHVLTEGREEGEGTEEGEM